ncbi:hypothetical protein GCM10027589_39890 [Actinocorallia lasiicapitis]
MTQLMPDLSVLALRAPENLAVLLAERALTYGWRDRTAFRWSDGTRTETITHGRVHESAARAAGVLAERGVRAGGRVLIVLPDGPGLVAALLGTFHLGAVAVTASPHATAEDHAHILRDADPWIVVCEPGLADRFGPVMLARDLLAETTGRPVRIPPPARVTHATPAYVQYTSGTTGPPKGVIHRHGDPLAYCRASGRALEVGRDDVLFSASKACYPWGFGVTVVFTLYFGASALLWPDRAGGPGIADQLRRHRPTLLFTTPPLYASLTSTGGLLGGPGGSFGGSLRAACTAGEPLLPALRDRVERALGCPLLDGLGSTEAGHTFVANTVRRRRDDTLGVVLDPYEISIRTGDGREAAEGETGSLYVRGPSIMAGYLNLPERTASALDPGGWLATGDLVHRDADGFIHHHGRAEDLEQLEGGRSVAPVLLERHLGGHPAVAEVAVVGDGRRLRAFVVPLPGLDPATHLREQLLGRTEGGVQEITFVPGLPRSPSGKIRRSVLRQCLTDPR